MCAQRGPAVIKCGRGRGLGGDRLAARLSQAQKNLSAEKLEELAACRAEAAEVLGVKDKNAVGQDSNPVRAL